MKYDSILFDLDGTLVNTLEAIEKTVNLSLEEMNSRNIRNINIMNSSVTELKGSSKGYF